MKGSLGWVGDLTNLSCGVRTANIFCSADRSSKSSTSLIYPALLEGLQPAEIIEKMKEKYDSSSRMHYLVSSDVMFVVIISVLEVYVGNICFRLIVDFKVACKSASRGRLVMSTTGIFRS